MLCLQFANYVPSSGTGVARRQWLGRDGSRTGSYSIMSACVDCVKIVNLIEFEIENSWKNPLFDRG